MPSNILKIFLVILVPLVICVGTLLYLKKLFDAPVSPGSQQQISVTLVPNQDFRDLCNLLEEKQLVRKWWVFYLLVKLKGDQGSWEAGEYLLSPSLTPTEILARISSGDVFLREVIIEPGSSVWQLGEVFEKAGVISKAAFDAEIKNPDLLARAGLRADSFEGYLFPGTYQFPRMDSAAQLIWQIMEAGERVWAPSFAARATSLGLSRNEILTIASIIEVESQDQIEREKISSVLHNRLSNGMKIQALPTVAYGLGITSAKVTRQDVEKNHPYNNKIKLA